jgi:diaminopimelate epimerase
MRTNRYKTALSYMKINFSKYHGTGNDFILIDGFNESFNGQGLTEEAIRSMCDRRFGIGADGLIILKPSEDGDFYMDYYNADGRPGSMCGNGSRCAVAFANTLGLIGDKTKFEASDGEHLAQIQGDVVHVLMNTGLPHQLQNGDWVIDTGSPHYISYTNDISQIDIVHNGRMIRQGPAFKDKGINVNFVEKISLGTIKVGTYERGVEAETYSCGTGVTACALIELFTESRDLNEINVITKGGQLRVKKADHSDTGHIWLIGPATFVYSGTVTV